MRFVSSTRLKFAFRAAAALALFAAAPLFAQTNYTTNITASKINASGGPVPYATVCAYAADFYGNPISVAAPTWGLLLKGTPAGCGSVVNGALSAPIPVPDSAHTDAAVPIYYNISIQQTNSSGVATSQPIIFPAVAGVTGTSPWALDAYVPAVNVPVTPSSSLNYQSSVPGSCTAPSIYLPSSPGTSPGYCQNGVYVPFASAGSGSGTSFTAYSGTTAYSAGQVVLYTNNIGYIASQSTTGNLPTNTTYWTPLWAAPGEPIGTAAGTAAAAAQSTANTALANTATNATAISTETTNRTTAVSAAIATAEGASVPLSARVGASGSTNVPGEPTTAPLPGDYVWADGQGGIVDSGLHADWRFTATAAWSSGTTYAAGNAVTYSGSVYGCIAVSCFGTTPGTSATTWYQIPQQSMITVAASNSLSSVKADFQCSGSHDDQCLQAIISDIVPPTTPGSSGPAGARLLMLPGVYNTNATITLNVDDLSLEGLNHPMWGQYIAGWTGPLAITSYSITSNVVTLVGCNSYGVGYPVVLINFPTSTFLNNHTFTTTTSSGGTCTLTPTDGFTHANVASTVEAGYSIPPNGAIGTGNAQLLAQSNYGPMITFTHSVNCGVINSGDSTARCRGDKIRQLYLVGFGYGNVGITNTGGADDNDEISDNVLQRLSTGISLGFDTPIIFGNSIQDVLGDAIDVTASTFNRVTNNLLFDIGGNGISETGPGEINGNIIGDCGIGVVVSATGSGSTVGTNKFNNCYQAIVGTGVAYGTWTGNNFVRNRSSALDGYDCYGCNAMAVSGNTAHSSSANAGFAFNFATSVNSAVAGNSAGGCWNSSGASAYSLGSNNTAATNTTNCGSTTTSAGTLFADYKASSLTGYTAGQTVTALVDSSGNGNNAPVVAGTTPLYESAGTINAGPTVRFVTSGNASAGFALPTANLGAGNQLTVFAVVNFNQFSIFQSIFNNYATQAMLNSSGVPYLITGNPIEGGTITYSGSQTLSVGTSHVIEYKFNGASTMISVDGCSSTGNANYAPITDGLWIGQNPTASTVLRGDLAEEAIYIGALQTSTAQTEGAALLTAYNITACGTSW